VPSAYPIQQKMPYSVPNGQQFPLDVAQQFPFSIQQAPFVQSKCNLKYKNTI
jgi:hypothetical protein